MTTATEQGPALPESRLYTLLDEPREFALYFLEGQKLIHDLALLHAVNGHGFAYFRDAVLSIQPLIAFLKRGEQLGFYIDSAEPFFRLKIETGHQGATRCTLMPAEFREFPDAIRGIVRLQKLFPHNRPPYESVLEIDGQPLKAIVNGVLDHSYQTNSDVIVSRRADQSAMLHQLPPLPGKDEYDYSPESLRARRKGMQDKLVSIFSKALHDPGEIERAFQGIGFRLLASRPVRFHCGCSKVRFVEGIHLACGGNVDQLFDPGQTALDVRCDYCKSRYTISREELHRTGHPLN